ncbi:MAG TPA: FGGY family carbohydrate kinase, partial [Desulfosarcina sp.]|nr:FGGY family carbohydrate kinase [Desulfosarcina sp.]
DRNGRPLAPCLIWMDRRAVGEVPSGWTDLVRSKTGITLDAGQMAAKMRWLLRHLDDPNSLHRFHQPVSYLVMRLTGRHVLDHAVASTSMVYSLQECDYDPELLDAFEIDRELLPDIAPAWSVAGFITAAGSTLSGLPEGIPVTVGTGDDYSTPLGAGLVAPGRFVSVLGTAEVVGALDLTAKIDWSGLVETHRYFGDSFFIENPGWLSGGSVEWFVRTWRLSGVGEMNRLAESAPPGSDGVHFLPSLSGAMAPEWIEAARGCFYGLTAAHGSAHMARAVFEGCAFAMLDVLQRLKSMDVPVESILLLGGGARSTTWAQIRSDMSGLPLTIPSRVDTSPVGAAMLAAVAGGIQPTLERCAELVSGEEKQIRPSMENHILYRAAHVRQRLLFDSLRPMYDEGR